MEGRPVTGPHGDPTAQRLAQLVDERGQILANLHALADWHETKADKARQFPGPGHVVAMTKAAEVHDDAARRIRRAINLEPTEEDQQP